MDTDQRKDGDAPPAVAAWFDTALLDEIATAIYLLDRQGLCRRFNHAAERLFGYTEAEVMGRSLYGLLRSGKPDAAPLGVDDVRRGRIELSQPDGLQASGSADGTREVMWSRDGRALPVRWSAAPIVVAGEPCELVTVNDLRPQRDAEAALRAFQHETSELLRQRDAALRVEQEMTVAETLRQRQIASQLEEAATSKLREQQELLNHVVEAAPVGIAVLDRELRFRWLNQPYAALLMNSGTPRPVPGDSFLTLVAAPPELEQIMRTVQSTGVSFQSVAFAYDMLPNGRTYWNWSVTRLPEEDLLITIQNVTEQTMAQHALVESDKMAAVGRLAASISHEINNPLEAVTNLLYLVHSDPELSEESHGYVELAETELSRVSRIASETLRFHRHAVEAVPRTPKQLVDPVLALYAGKLKSSHVQVSIDFDGAEPVKTFEGDIRQILNNLIGNAIDAMLRGGELRIRTRQAHCMRTGRRGVRITVADTGHGMSAETASRIFEPFYTTKGASGSGLGLWISHTLAERQGGKLQVRSCREGNPKGKPHGTTFSLFVPSQEHAVAQDETTATLQ